MLRMVGKSKITDDDVFVFVFLNIVVFSIQKAIIIRFWFLDTKIEKSFNVLN